MQVLFVTSFYIKNIFMIFFSSLVIGVMCMYITTLLYTAIYNDYPIRNIIYLCQW